MTSTQHSPKTHLRTLGLVMLPVSLFLVLPKACSLIPVGGLSTYEGVIDVPRHGWAYATFDSAALSVENRRRASLGRQKVELNCVIPGSLTRRLDSALARSVSDENGRRAIWVRFTARNYQMPSPCMQQWARGKRQRWGSHLRIADVIAIRPLACNHWQLVIGRARCEALQ